MKINIVVGGHFSYEALQDNVLMLKGILSTFNFDVEINDWPKDGYLNLVYEGHHPENYQAVQERMKLFDRNCLIIVCTEEVAATRLLSSRFYTFNHFGILSEKSWRRHFTALRLLSLHFRYQITNLRISQRIPKFLNNWLRPLALSQLDYSWKDRYQHFYKISRYFAGFISTYDQNYKTFGFRNTFYLPHLFTKDDLAKTVESKEDFYFDCIFTGALTKHRIELIKSMEDAGLRVCAPGIVADDERWKLLNSSAIVLGLLKDSKQYQPSTNRTYMCLKYGLLLINERAARSDYLDEYVMNSPTQQLIPNIKKVLASYETHVHVAKEKRTEALAKWDAQIFEKSFNEYIQAFISKSAKLSSIDSIDKPPSDNNASLPVFKK